MKTADTLTFPSDTSPYLQEIIAELLNARVRVKLTYDYSTDNDTFERFGYIGCTTGNHTPIIVHNARSCGGAPIDIAHLVRIEPSRGGIPYYVRRDPIIQ